MKLKIIFNVIGVLIVAVCFSFFGFWLGHWQSQEELLKEPPLKILNPDNIQSEILATTTGSVDFSIFWETWRRVEQSYLKRNELDYNKMVYGAVSGMVNSLGDPYTVFFTPKQADDFNEELSGLYEGVGMVVGIKNETLTVVSPFKGTPADMAGLKTGDEIVKVGDSLTKNMSIEEAVSLIKGPRGTQVKLLILREGWTEPKEFILKRDAIKIPTMETELKENDTIIVIKLFQFNRLASSEFQKVVLQIFNSTKTKGIVFDLRDNPGGFLDEAINIAGWFVKKGDVVTWQDTGDKDNEKPYESSGPASLADYPTVVLINGGSASGSEILAGALRDKLGIKLIGEKSFGKGSVQDQINLSGGASLKVTIARWLTPNKISINEQGLAPDFEVKLSTATSTDQTIDVQLEKGIEILKGLM